MKKSSILLVTNPTDTHALAVAEGLRNKGADATLWFTSNYPSRATETIRIEGSETNIDLVDAASLLTSRSFDTVWHRRPAFAIDTELLDDADHKYAQVECRIFRQSLLTMLAPDAFWVNRRDAAQRADLKPWQHQQAARVGLKVPDTLYTNDPQAIRQFIRAQGGSIIFKPLIGQLWESEDKIAAPMSTVLRERDLIEDDLLRQVPAIYQALVPKAYERRVTMMGHRAFAAKLLSQETANGKVDWRQAADEMTMTPFPSFPEKVRRQCVALMERMGLVFGCFDFIVTPEGEYVFLEVNQMGQFLFVDGFTGMPLLDAFCEFLIQARPDFDWSEDRVSVRYENVGAAVEAAYQLAGQQHVQPPARALAE